MALDEKLRRMIDPDRQRLKASRGHDVHHREQLPADRHRRLETRRDRSERRVLRHVFRILLIMLIGDMTGIGARMRMVRLGRDRIVVMHKESAKRLMRMSHRKEQCDGEQNGSAVAQKGHQRGAAIAQRASAVKPGRRKVSPRWVARDVEEAPR